MSTGRTIYSCRIRLLSLGQLAAFGFLGRVAEAFAGVFVAEVDQGGNVDFGGQGVEGVDQAVGACAGGVVLAPWSDG